MNLKELEVLVNEQAASISALVKFTADQALVTASMGDRLGGMFEQLGAMHEAQKEFVSKIEELEVGWASHVEALSGFDGKLEGLAEMVGARNKSAALKRNMTDKDALEVLNGQYGGMDHKAAAEAIGLTYAQVYSCRMEYTFKHVHKKLRDEQWANPWKT